MNDFFDDLDGVVHNVEGVSHIPVDPTWRPDDDFVICRDVGGKPTAVYGKPVWDFNPMRLRAAKISNIRFDKIFEVDTFETIALVNETKYFLFCIFFYVQSGRLGRISVQTLYTYSRALKLAAQFCYSQKANPLIGVLSFSQLFSNPAYLSADRGWMDNNKVSNQMRSYTRSLILHLTAIGEERLGFRIQGVFSESFGVKKETGHQHPVIPTRIYIGMINDLGDFLDLVFAHKDRLENFLNCFKNPLYGHSIEYQVERLGAEAHTLQLTLPQAIQAHGLETLLFGDLRPIGKGRGEPNRSAINAVVMKIHWLLKNVIHLYTGMRDQEVMRLPYNCMDAEQLVSATTDEEGIVRDGEMVVNIISTTTKFTGYRKSSAWLATECVVRAVEVGQAICRAVSRVYSVEYDKMPLFLSPVVIVKPGSVPHVPYYDDNHRLGPFSKYFLQENDLEELYATDPSRNYANDESFQVGSCWNFTSHQFRRSLAFYGSSSGFISLPSLRKQFKHLSIQMSRYYANNFEKLKTIFGYYDSEKDDFVLPKNHFLFEYQTGVPMNIAYDLLDHAFGDGSALFGGVGSYISNQRQKMDGGDIHISDLRKETEKLAMDGKISYRPTLLGGCTKVGKCDAYLLGNAVSCLTCAEGILEKEKLESAISDDEAQLAMYEPGTGEYQVVDAELTSFKKYYQRFIAAEELV